MVYIIDILNGSVYHSRDKDGLECGAAIHLRNSRYGLIEIKLGGDKHKKEQKMETQKLTELVINAQKGDKIAMDTIVSETYQELYYYVLKTVKNEDLAYDVTQESFVEIITTIENLREPAAFPLWARRIAYHKCAPHFRQSKEIIIEENDDGETIFDQLPDVSEDTLPEAVVEDEEFRTTLLNMINSLPAEQTNALLLYYYEKRSVGEIAEIQGVTQGTVKSRLNYARKAIKGKVEEHESKTGT